MNNPPVTVLMSVYNGARYLGEAIDSILGQTYRNFEFLIIDDGSTDDSVGIINSYDDPRIRLQQHPNRGLAESLRQGVIDARGDIIVRADADDISYPSRIERQVNLLQTQADIGLCRTMLDWIDQDGKIFRRNWDPNDTDDAARWQILWKNIGSHSSGTFRKNTLIKHGINYRSQINGLSITNSIEDYDLWSQLLPHTKFRIIDEPLVQYRAHAASMMQTGEELRLQQLFAEVVKENFFRITISIPDSVANAISVLSCQTLTDPVHYQYAPLIGYLHKLENDANNLLAADGDHAPKKLRAKKYLIWSRYFLNTSRVYSLKLLAISIWLAPRDALGVKHLSLLTAAVMPATCLKALTKVRAHIRIALNKSD